MKFRCVLAFRTMFIAKIITVYVTLLASSSAAYLSMNNIAAAPMNYVLAAPLNHVIVEPVNNDQRPLMDNIQVLPVQNAVIQALNNTVAPLIKTHENCRNKTYECFCGSNKNTTISITVEMCLKKNKKMDTKYCEPCYQLYPEENYCANFKNCLTCTNNPNRCDLCPHGRSGMFCEMVDTQSVPNVFKVVVFPGQAQRVVSYIGRNKPKLQCSTPIHLTTAEVRCIQDEYSMTCFLNCIWGFSYPDGAESRIINCHPNSSVWQPTDFEECIERINCELELINEGTLRCATRRINEPDQCIVSCRNGTSSTHICLRDGSWHPSLPSCVRVAELPFPSRRPHAYYK